MEYMFVVSEFNNSTEISRPVGIFKSKESAIRYITIHGGTNRYNDSFYYDWEEVEVKE